MDPTACLERIEWESTRHLPDRDSSALLLACWDLQEWLDRGGFEPDWARHPAGAARFQAFLASEGA